MKRVYLLSMAVTLACAHPSPQPPASAPAVECPACPACPDKVCPAQTCPPCPEPAPPVADDWYCFVLYRSHMPPSGFCRPSALACEHSARNAVARKVGKPGPCAPQRIAHCFLVYNQVDMMRQHLCARTAKICEERRVWTKEHPIKKTERVSACAAIPNTQRSEFEKLVPWELPPVPKKP